MRIVEGEDPQRPVVGGGHLQHAEVPDNQGGLGPVGGEYGEGFVVSEAVGAKAGEIEHVLRHGHDHAVNALFLHGLTEVLVPHWHLASLPQFSRLGIGGSTPAGIVP